MPPKIVRKNRTTNENLKEQAMANTTATKTVDRKTETLVEGTPLEHTKMHNINKSGSRTVGVNVGSTINMGDFQSLRVDCWLTDELLDGETHTEGLQRLTEVASEHLRYMADELAN